MKNCLLTFPAVPAILYKTPAKQVKKEKATMNRGNALVVVRRAVYGSIVNGLCECCAAAQAF
jgi:hypothetical protein